MTPRIVPKNRINSIIPGLSKLEKDIDLAPLFPLARREGNSKKPVYQMHKWWARRLGVNFRFFLLNATSQSRTRNKTIWRKFFNPDLKLDLTVLDPFMGGGTSIVEATKLGARTIGVDLDPLAWFIVNKQICEFDEASFIAEWKVIQNDIGDKISSYYKTKVNGKTADVIHFFWVELIPCQSCHREFEGHIHYLLHSRKSEKSVNPRCVGFCQKCHEPHTLQNGEKFINCKCGEQTEVEKGNLHLGKYRCPHCNHQGFVKDVPLDSLPLQQRLFAIEYIDPDTGKRAYKQVDDNDEFNFAKACQDLNQLWTELPIPDQYIPLEGRTDPRPVSFGYKKYHELFNNRQLLCLALILKRILDVKNEKHRELLLLAFSDSLACNNKFCSYAFGYQKLTPLFGLHAFRRISRPVEGNVWGTSIGRGSFSSSVEKVLRGKRYSAKPFEYRYTDRETEHVEGTLSANASIIDDVKNLNTSSRQSSFLTIADSRDLLWLPEKSVDLVLTDPPYYDNLAYSEMADFYYVWLKDHVNWINTRSNQHAPMKNSLLVRSDDEEEHSRYTEGLSHAFSGCRKAIKDEGIMIFTYHHTNQKAWESVTMALRASDFEVTNCFPVLAEGKSGFHSNHGNLKWDVVFVCRPGLNDKAPKFSIKQGKRWISSRIAKWTDESHQKDKNFRDIDKRSLVFGLIASYLTRCKMPNDKVRDVFKHFEEEFSLKQHGHVQMTLVD